MSDAADDMEREAIGREMDEGEASVSTPGAPRTWTLKMGPDEYGELHWSASGLCEPPGSDREIVKAYEAGPVDAERERLLDLLVALEELLSLSTDLTEGDDCNLDAARDLLREYGRLGHRRPGG